MATDRLASPGLIALLGSGETAPSGGAAFERLARDLPPPLRVAVLETPAGFQPNAAEVAGRVVEYLGERLHNYHPRIASIAARQRNSAFSPDDPALLDELIAANMFVLGPGSPTYAARQLAGSLTWQTLLARHRQGAAIALSSAGVIAASAYALPVYEIYKVGAAPHWVRGLDVFGAYGLTLALMPHWNNSEGGQTLDTSHCFMGRERFARLRAFLPPPTVIVGIDEHTSLLVDLGAATCQVMGLGRVTLLGEGRERSFQKGEWFPAGELGPFRAPAPAAAPEPQPERSVAVPAEITALVDRRRQARSSADWAAADALRQELLALGWKVVDTGDGTQIERYC